MAISSLHADEYPFTVILVLPQLFALLGNNHKIYTDYLPNHSLNFTYNGIFNLRISPNIPTKSPDWINLAVRYVKR
jgi:hypothetical protein